MIISPEYVCWVVPITTVGAAQLYRSGRRRRCDRGIHGRNWYRYSSISENTALGAVLCPVDGAAGSDIIIIVNIFISLKLYTHDFSAQVVVVQ